ncbi:hypothetical protein BF93_10485 [Brachybacterium phenoliresistens]|uniref:Uncharacterized protein n=1 Tax=Brachybacterium phenoliresistens TaxID=396014 RepID=Z9JW53_9MICO|nr:hypothetical protein [Brachybacterium phenoliresistens]EWS82434.1 hypothetical protein BF93_10485 [Brachybacterium phenoliresistens]
MVREHRCAHAWLSLATRREAEGSALGGGMFDTAADTVRGGKMWAFAYSGHPEVITAQLQQGLAAQGVPHAEALQGVALPERSVGASPQGARARINGLAR